MIIAILTTSCLKYLASIKLHIASYVVLKISEKRGQQHCPYDVPATLEYLGTFVSFTQCNILEYGPRVIQALFISNRNNIL